MSDEVTLSCHCGAFTARLREASAQNGNHGLCYCADCQAFARHLEQFGVVTDAAGGTEIYQTQPHRFEILTGQEHLALLRLNPKGLNRWYAKCCNTPICNTPGNPKIAFAGVLAANLTAAPGALGPIRFRYKRESAVVPVTEPSGSMLRFIARSVSAILKERVSGRWKKTPFFGEDGRSVVAPYVLSEAERDAAYGTEA